jgi:isopenicillin-N epimerase
VKLAQHTLREWMEAEPVRFFIEDYRTLMDDARAAIASFVKCDAGDIAPIANATTAVATVLHNLQAPLALKAGDEILANDHEYPACMNILRDAAGKAGAKVVTATLPFPCPSPQAIVDAIMAKVTPKTRLVLLSHVTSPSAMVLPVETLVPMLRARGIETLVDGAHAPGMIASLDISHLDPTYYTANCHKWLCSPKGSAFLYVSKERRARRAFRPLVLSNFAESPIAGRDHFLTEFDYTGTSDQTAFMAIRHSIRAMSEIAAAYFNLQDTKAHWPAIMQHNHDLALRGREVLCKALNVEPPVPDSMIGSVATIILPAHPPQLMARLRQRPTRYHDALQDTLIQRHHIQVPVWSVDGRPLRTLRTSAQLYNSAAQYECLARALVEELERERQF